MDIQYPISGGGASAAQGVAQEVNDKTVVDLFLEMDLEKRAIFDHDQKNAISESGNFPLMGGPVSMYFVEL